MNKILTIVVPAYNAEKYLRKNLNSFCINTILEDIEVIVVNDGSTDNSLTIAEEYATRYPDTYIQHQKGRTEKDPSASLPETDGAKDDSLDNR